MLRRRIGGKDGAAGSPEVNVHEPASAAVVRVALWKTGAGRAVSEHIHAVDLEMRPGRRGPDEAAHPAVADGQSLLAAPRSLDIRKIGMRHEPGIVHAQEAGSRTCPCGGVSDERS